VNPPSHRPILALMCRLEPDFETQRVRTSMKRRWLAVLLLAALPLGACTPAESGAGPDTPSPAPADHYDGC